MSTTITPVTPAAAPPVAAPVSTPAPPMPSAPAVQPAAAPASQPSPGIDALVDKPLGASMDEIWAKKELAKTSQATPEPGPTLEAVPGASSEVKPVEAPAATPVTTPVEPLQAIRTELETAKTALTTAQQEATEVKATLAALEGFKPQIEVLQTPGVAQALMILKPAFDSGIDGWDDPRAGEIGKPLLKALGEFDGGLTAVLVKGVFEEYEQQLGKYALKKLGIEDVRELQDFQARKAGVEGLPHTTETFPELTALNSEGYVVIPIHGGEPMEIDPENAKDLALYNSQKSLFDGRIAEQKRVAGETKTRKEAETAAQVAAQEAANQVVRTRQREWEVARETHNKALYESLTEPKDATGQVQKLFTGHYEWMDGPCVATAQLAMMKDARLHDPKTGLYNRGMGAFTRGEGRSAEDALAYERIAAQHITNAVKQFQDLIKENADLRAAAAQGQPVLPAGAPKIVPGVTDIKAAGNGSQQASAVPTALEVEGPAPGEEYDSWIKRISLPGVRSMKDLDRKYA